MINRPSLNVSRVARSSRAFGLLCFGTLLLTGCSSFFLGKENLSEPVDLPPNPASVSLARQWQHSIGDGTADKALGLLPLVTQQQIVAVSNDGKLLAFDADSGSRQWRTDVGHSVAAGVGGDGKVVAVGSENGLLMVFDATDGELLWTYQLSTEIMAAPTVAGGLVVARAIDGQVTALDASNGNVVWKQYIGVADLSIRGNARSLFFDGVLLFTNGKGRLTLLSAADGQPVFEAPIVRGRGMTAVQRIADLLATPTLRDGKLFVSAYRHKTLAIDLQNGGLLWESELATAQDLFADNRLLYIVDKNSVIYALDLRNGKAVWQTNIAEGRKLSPLAGDGRRVMTVDNQGQLLVLDTRDGELLGYGQVGDERTYVAPQWVNGQWLTYTGDGDLTLTEISP